jgi:hypothetical protein
MRDAGVNGYDEVEQRHQRRGVAEVAELATALDHIAALQCVDIAGTKLLLQAYEGRVDIQKRQQIG